MELPRWLNSWTNPVWAIGGVIEDRSLLAGHFDHLSSLVSDDTTLEQAMKNPKSLLRQRAFELCRNLVGPP